MMDLPLVQVGAFVSVALSNDEDHPGSNVIDGNDQTFWMTTGLFPQSLVITLPNLSEIKVIKITSLKIRNLIIEKSTKSSPNDFEIIAEKSLKNEDRKLQSAEIPIVKGVDARHLKFIITEAYDSFAAIQHIKVEFSKGSR